MMLLFVTYTWSQIWAKFVDCPTQATDPFFILWYLYDLLENSHWGKKFVIFLYGNFLRKFSTHIFSHPDICLSMEKKIILIIGDQKSMINLNQFKTTIWAKHNTQWKWSKTLKMITLVWRMQMWKSWRI